MSYSTTRKYFVLLWMFLSLTAIAETDSSTHREVRTMPMESVVGSECSVTGARVEAVATRPDVGEQVVTVSIPRSQVAKAPSFRLYRIDSQAFALESYKEIQQAQDPDRRSFAFVVKESDRFQFKLAFDSAQ